MTTTCLAHAVPTTTTNAAAADATSAHCLQWTRQSLADWAGHQGGPTMDVHDPSSGEWLWAVPALDAAAALRAVEQASAVWPAWRARTAAQRAQSLRRWAALMRGDAERLAVVLTLEQGKPLFESRQEIEYAASYLDWFADESLRIGGELLPSHLNGSRLLLRREPIGVTAAVTPWNFPVAMVVRKAAAALAAGCVMVLKPAPQTPASAILQQRIALEAGIPAGAFQVLTGDAEELVSVWTASDTVRHLSFTGSTDVGRRLLARCAATVKKVALELGGHAPFIVLPGADVERAVADAVAAKFATTGQDCLAVNRFIVHAGLYQPFCQRLTEVMRTLKVGRGLDAGVHLGPLIDARAVQRCQTQVDDALAQGARLLTGGTVHPLGPNFYPPTMLMGLQTTMRLFREETFGPVAAAMPFDNVEQAIGLANDSHYGLAAYVQGPDALQAWRVGEALDYGMVAVNTARMTGAQVPFGGVKHSGLGREGSRHGLEEFTQLRYLCIADRGDVAARDLIHS
jgi:succinate-semialdehyde dehydrogenase